MNEQELKACPCCGHQAELRENELILNGDLIRAFYVICGNIHCRIRTPARDSQESAARIWNRRTQL